jgi:hypothetical protein
MNRLLEIGFEPAGHWLLQGERVTFELLRHATQRNILYAFVCDGQVKYVGKTVRELALRMSGYKNPGKTQTTNIRNNARIKELLVAGVAVEILALPDNGLLHYGQFHLNLAAALEDDIIRLINPEWNGGAVEKPSNAEANPVLAEEVIPDRVGTFSFVLQPTYFKSGFFNAGVSSQKFLGGDGETIELFLGAATNPVLGTINRRANLNATPRIMGGTRLRDWFASVAAPMSEVVVMVMSPNSIRLHAKKAN